MRQLSKKPTTWKEWLVPIAESICNLIEKHFTKTNNRNLFSYKFKCEYYKLVFLFLNACTRIFKVGIYAIRAKSVHVL